MRLRTFTAADMPSAMKLVRDALGDEAIILSTKELPHLRSISVTAAIDDEDRDSEIAEQSAPHVSDVASGDVRYGVQEIFRFHNFPEFFISKFLQNLTDADIAAALAQTRINAVSDTRHFVRLALEKLIGKLFECAPLPLDFRTMRLMLVGPPGIGKTLTIAKLATTLTMDKKNVVVITTDVKRAGGVEQLKAFTDILDIPLQTAGDKKTFQRCLKLVPADSTLLVDTAGCNAFDDHDLKELQDFITPGIEPVLALPASGDSLETLDIVEHFMTLPIKRLLITRTDNARRFGGALTAAAAHQLALCHAGSSASVTDPLQAVTPKLVAQWLLRYQLQTS